MVMSDDEVRTASELYANCRDGKYSFVNSTEWLRSFDGHTEGMKQGYKLGIEEAVSFLRSKEVNKLYDESFGNYGPFSIAEWIEDKLK
jgi:hypothetical protein